MKHYIKRIVALAVLMVYVSSLVGCSYIQEFVGGSETVSKTKDADENEFSEADEEALEIIEECMEECLEEMGDEYEEYDGEKVEKALEEAKEKMDEIDVDDCSKEAKNLIAETQMLLDELDCINEMFGKLETFYTDMEAIVTATEAYEGFENATTTQEMMTLMEGAYDSIVSQAEQMDELPCPQYMDPTRDQIVNLYNSLATVMADMYYACNNEDFVSMYSDLCFYLQLQSDTEAIVDDLTKSAEDLSQHLEVITTRIEDMGTEIDNNMELMEDGNYDDVKFTYLEEEKKVNSTIECIDTIYPAMYNRLNAVSILTLSCMQGDYDVLITAEVDGFSQKFEKTVTLGMEPQRIYVKPPVLTTGLDLDTQSTTQIKVSVTEIGSGNVLASETSSVTIMSINDFILSDDEYGYTNHADVLAWVTPESDYIQELLRYAAMNMGDYFGTEGIYGYQYFSDDLDELNTTAYQLYAIHQAVSDVGVRYVNSAYSIGQAQNATQRVNRPDETLESGSGICIETSVLLASAFQAAGFDSMIVLTTGHCQVAVETWADSGDYILFETTVLPVGGPHDEYGYSDYMNTVMTVLSDEEWEAYLSENDGYVYNCNMATQLGITPLTY